MAQEIPDFDPPPPRARGQRVAPQKWYSVTVFGDFSSERHRTEFDTAIMEHVAPDADGNLTRDIDYGCYQWEMAPTTGRVHAQMCLYFKTKVRPHSVVTWINQFPHTSPPYVEKAFNPANLILYCSKEESRLPGTIPLSFGIEPKEGKATGLVRAAFMLQEGSTLRSIAQTYPAEFVRHYRGLAALQNTLLEPDDEGQPPTPPQVRLYFGAPGSGKSSLARTWRDPGQRIYVVPVAESFWLDGYNGQEIALIDEYQGQFPLALLLRLLDGFPVRVPVKGGFTWWKPSRVAFTSTAEPSLWYNYHGRLDQYAALLRRITSVVLCYHTEDGYSHHDADLGRWKSLLVPRCDPPRI